VKPTGKYINLKAALGKKRPLSSKFVIPQQEIVQYFSDVGSKKEVIEGFLNFSGSCFANMAIFSIFSRSMQLLKGVGDNIKAPLYLGSLDIDKNSVVRRVVINKFPYRGNIPVGTEEKAVFSKFFNSFAEEIFLYPGSIVGEETDVLFYADAFQANRESAIATFEYIIEKTVLALKYLWVQKQLNTV
jgi:hypothetical protein